MLFSLFAIKLFRFRSIILTDNDIKQRTTMNRNNNIRKEPFVMPEGYLEGLTQRVMDKIPEGEYQRMAYRRRTPWLARGIVAAVVVLLSAVWYNYGDFAQQQMTGETVETAYDDNGSMEAFAEYAMLDQQDIYELIIEK